MPNPNVDALVAAVSNALERWFDRTKNAINAARTGGYAFEQFANDTTETWMDGTYVTLLPLTLFAPFNVSAKPPFPIVRFKMITRNDAVRSVPAPNLAGAGNLVSENLTDGSGANAIPSANVAPTKTQNNTLLTVNITNLGQLNPAPPAGFYSGRVIDQGSNRPIARIEVDLP